MKIRDRALCGVALMAAVVTAPVQAGTDRGTTSRSGPNGRTAAAAVLVLLR